MYGRRRGLLVSKYHYTKAGKEVRVCLIAATTAKLLQCSKKHAHRTWMRALHILLLLAKLACTDKS